RGIDDHDFDDGNALGRIGDGGEQLLGDDRLEVKTHAAAQRRVHLARKKIENTADRRRCTRGVDRPEHEVTGFGGMHGRLERFHIAHFAHQHDVGVFADGVLHGNLEVFDVDADFALVDERLVFAVYE